MQPPDPHRERFDALFDGHYAAVQAYARRRTDPVTADEVVAETFLVAWRRLDDAPADALPWLLGVARKTLANQRRTAARTQALRERLVRMTPAGVPVTDPIVDDPRTLRLADALAALTDAEREAILLVAWEGLAPRDAAIAAGCSRAAFRVRLHRARRRLAQALDHSAPPTLGSTAITRDAP